MNIPDKILKRLEDETNALMNSGDDLAILNELFELKKENWILRNGGYDELQ